MTLTEESAIAAAAMIGDSRIRRRVEHAGRDRHADRVVDEGEEQVLADVAHGRLRERRARTMPRGRP